MRPCLSRFPGFAFFFSFIYAAAQPPEHNIPKENDPYRKKLETLQTASKFSYPSYFAKKSFHSFDFRIYEYSDPPQLEVNESVSSELVAAEDNAVFKTGIFFDDQSSIRRVKVKDEDGLELPVEVLYGNYQNENIFHDDLKVGVFEVNFPSAGSERTVEYKKIYRDYKYLSRIYFSTEFPARQSEIRVQVPAWLKVDFQRFNFEHYNVKETEEKKYSIDGKHEYTTYIFTAENVPAFANEKNSPSGESVYPHLFILFKSLTHEGKEYDLLKDMQGLYNWCSGLCAKVENDTSVFRPLVEELTAGKSSDSEKIESIFYWVQDKVRYIAFEEGIMGYKPASADKVYSKLYGDCKGMANLLKHMLRLAGYDARLCWIGTRDIPYDQLFPVLGIFNHMICCVDVNGKRYFLDATEDFGAFGENAYRLQGKTVMIEDGEKFITDIVPVTDVKANLLHSEIKMKVSGDKITGTKTSVYNGEEKLNFLTGYSEIKTEDKEKSLKNYLTFSDKNIRLSNITHSDLKDRKNPVSISYDFEIDNYIINTGGELYVYVDFDREYEKYYFDTLRTTDWTMDHRVYVSTRNVLELPTGYELKSELKNISVNEDDFSFSVKTELKGNEIVYSRQIIFKNAIIRSGDFRKWNQLNAKLREVYNTPLVFRKKDVQ